MSKIIIGFSRPKAWFEPFSWLIRLVTWAPMSHAYIRYWDDYSKKEIVFQASGLKVNFIGYPLFKSNEIICAEFEVDIPEDVKLKIVQFSVDSLGTSYGILQIVGFLWIYFMKLFGKNVSNPLYSSSTDFCSELVTKVLESIPGSKDTQDPGVVTPKEAYRFMLSQGYTICQSNGQS